MVERMKKMFQPYSARYVPNSGDVLLVGSATGATAFVVWIVSLFGQDIPQGAAGFLGAILGLLVARYLKPSNVGGK